LSRVFLDSLCHGRNRRLFLRLLPGGLLGGVFNDNRRIGCSLVGDVARIDIRCRTSKRRHHVDIKIRIKNKKK
jgi:hypothetical protein